MRRSLFRVAEELHREDYHLLRPLVDLIENVAENGPEEIVCLLVEAFRQV